jgi:hypothetical protein
VRFQIIHLKELQTKPDSTSWSLGQVYRHLIEETTWYYGQIALSLTETKNQNEEMTDQAKTMFAANEFPDCSDHWRSVDFG